MAGLAPHKFAVVPVVRGGVWRAPFIGRFDSDPHLEWQTESSVRK